jgi:hypothetical protein
VREIFSVHTLLDYIVMLFILNRQEMMNEHHRLRGLSSFSFKQNPLRIFRFDPIQSMVTITETEILQFKSENTLLSISVLFITDSRRYQKMI